MRSLLNFLLFLFFLNSTFAQLKRKSLRAYPLAKCNNGSPASFYFTAGNLKNPNLLIHLQGGGKCSSADECKKRCTKDKPSLCKTRTAKTMNQDLPSSHMWLVLIVHLKKMHIRGELKIDLILYWCKHWFVLKTFIFITSYRLLTCIVLKSP